MISQKVPRKKLNYFILWLISAITPAELETIRKLGGTAIKVVDILENESEYYICQLDYNDY